jgi:hypothetical protein
MHMSWSPRPLSSKNLPAAALAAALIFGAACQPDIDTDPLPPQNTTRAVFDPTTSTIPVPNSAALDADGTLRSLGMSTGADQVFNTWFDQLNGWLPETPITIPFSAALDEATLTSDNIKLYSITATGLTELPATFVYATLPAEGNPTPARATVTVVPAAPLAYGTSYGVVVTDGVKDTAGLSIRQDSAIFFALDEGPIVDEDGNIMVPQLRPAGDASDADRAADIATAKSLEGLRRVLRPFYEQLKATDVGGSKVTRDRIVTAFSWRTTVDVFTVLDSTTGTIPLPNTLAMEADGTFPARALPTLSQYNAELKVYQDAVDAGTDPLPARPERTAQVYFDQYLDGLHGWPNAVASIPVELPVSGAIDPASITADSIQLYELNADGSATRITELTVEFVAERKVIKILPTNNFKLDANYFALATRDIKTPDGKNLLPPAAVLLAMQPDPVVNAEGKSLVARVSDGQAAQIAGVQTLLKPAMAAISAEAGLGYDQLSSVWTWFTWKDPFVQFDPTTGDIPFPNAFLVNSMTGLINLPTAGVSGLQAALFQEFNTRDGFSVLGGAWLTITGELDETTLTTFTGTPNSNNGGAIGFGYVDGLPKLIAGDTGYEVKYFKDDHKLFIQPLFPLRKSVTHAAIISERIKGTNGLSVQPTPVTVFLGSPAPLVDDAGKSLVAQLDDATAATLEPARGSYKQLFELGGPLLTGDDRETIAGMFAFSTDNANTPMQRQRAMAARKVADDDAGAMVRACVATGDCIADPNYVVNPGAAYAGDFSGGAPQNFSNIAAIQFAGELESANFLDLATGTLKPYADAAAQKIGVTVYVPKTVIGTCEAPFDTIVVAHGVGGWRLSANAIANDLAASCLATVAIDFPLHGGRIAGSSNLHPKTYPAGSGANFLSADVLRTKSNFLQAASDLFTLTESIKAGELENLVTGAGDTFSGNIGYLGISLGSIIGTSVITSDPNLEVVVLNVPSGKLSYYITEMSNIGQGLRDTLTMLLMTTADSFLFAQTVSLVQWALDFVDPVSAAPYMLTSTLNVVNFDPATGMFSNAKNGADDVKVTPAKILIQMAQDDQTTPNVGTRQLYDSILMLVPAAQRPNQPLYPLEKATFNAEHAFILTTDTQAASFKASSCARRQAAAWLSSGLTTGTAAVPAALEATPCVAN